MSTHISVPPQLLLERILTLEIVRVTERAAVVCGAAARPRPGKAGRPGRGRRDAARAQQAADRGHHRDRRGRARRGADAVHRREGRLKAGPKVDIAVDPLEGTTLCAKNMPGAIATMAMADGGTLLHAPDVYMDKIAIGPGYPEEHRRSRRAAGREHPAPRQGQGRPASAITALVLDRPRHAAIIEAIRNTGAAVRADHRRRRRRRDPHR